MIRKLIRNRARSAGIICEECFDSQFMKYKKEQQTQQYNQRKLEQDKTISFFGFTDNMEQMRTKTLLSRVYKREKITKEVSKSLVMSYSLNDSQMYNETNDQNQALSKQVFEITTKKAMLKKLMLEVDDTNRSMINDKLKQRSLLKQKEAEAARKDKEFLQMNSYIKDEKEMKKKDETRKLLKDYSEKAFQKKMMNDKMAKGYSKTMLNFDNKEKKIKEEFRVTCTHGVDMIKCTICNKIIAKDKMYYNLFALKLDNSHVINGTKQNNSKMLQ